jgi:hypothetical protein
MGVMEMIHYLGITLAIHSIQSLDMMSLLGMGDQIQ